MAMWNPSSDCFCHLDFRDLRPRRLGAGRPGTMCHAPLRPTIASASVLVRPRYLLPGDSKDRQRAGGPCVLREVLVRARSWLCQLDHTTLCQHSASQQGHRLSVVPPLLGHRFNMCMRACHIPPACGACSRESHMPLVQPLPGHATHRPAHHFKRHPLHAGPLNIAARKLRRLHNQRRVFPGPHRG